MQRRLGVRDDLAHWASRFVRSYMPDQHRLFYGELPFLVAAARDAEGRPWATLLAGRPGFVTSEDPRELAFGAVPVAGDALEHALVERTPVGLLGIDLATRRRNRVNGWISAVASRDALQFEVAQSFGNCPQYIREREWTWVEAGGADAGERRVGQRLPEDLHRRIERAETFFIATGVEEAPAESQRAVGMDASHRGGPAGFVRVQTDGSLLFPDYAGNNFYNTFGNLEVDPRAGLLFVDFESGGMLQLSGRAEVLWDDPRVADFEGAQRLVRFLVDSWRDLPAVLPLRWVSRTVARRARVVDRVQESRDVTSFFLESIDHPLPVPRAGQYVPVLMEWADGEARRATEDAGGSEKKETSEETSEETGKSRNAENAENTGKTASPVSGQLRRAERTYSLSGRPQEGIWRISVRRHDRGLVSRLLHDAVTVGDVVRVGEPTGDFLLPEGGRSLVFVAGGVGITPLLSMLHDLDARRDSRSVMVFHSVRDPVHQPFAAELEELQRRARQQGRRLEVRTRWTRHAPAGGLQRLSAPEIVGELEASGLRGADGRDVDVMLCGPPAMVEQLGRGLEAAGFDPASIRSESF